MEDIHLELRHDLALVLESKCKETLILAIKEDL
jgi:hypothetical protein